MILQQRRTTLTRRLANMARHGQNMARHGQIWLAYWTCFITFKSLQNMSCRVDIFGRHATPVDQVQSQNMSSCPSSHGPWCKPNSAWGVMSSGEERSHLNDSQRILNRVDNRQILEWYVDIGLPTELNEFIVSLSAFLQLHRLKLLDMFSSLIYSASEWQWGINDYPEWKMKASLATSMVP